MSAPKHKANCLTFTSSTYALRWVHSKRIIVPAQWSRLMLLVLDVLLVVSCNQHPKLQSLGLLRFARPRRLLHSCFRNWLCLVQGSLDSQHVLQGCCPNVLACSYPVLQIVDLRGRSRQCADDKGLVCLCCAAC